MGQANNPQLERERAVYNYLDALERGDIDGIIDVLNQAVYDAPLDQMVAEAHQVFFQEEGTHQAELAEMDTREMPMLEPATLRSDQPEQKRRIGMRKMSRWTQAFAAMLIVSVLVGSFIALISAHQGPGSPVAPGKSTPTGQLPACYPFKKFDAPYHGINSDRLISVIAVSANEAWAVGDYSGASPAGPHDPGTLIEHWNGQNWQIVSSPNGPAGSDTFGSLSAVAAASANDVWAVGFTYTGAAPPGKSPADIGKTLIEHWNGLNWQVVSSPNGSTGHGILNDLSIISQNDIWAVGSFEGTDQLSHPLVEHWDGANWQVVPLQGASRPAIGLLFSITATSAHDIWAVGEERNVSEQKGHGLVEHWNGSQWQSVTVPQDSWGLNSVSALSPSDVWIAGSDANNHPLIEHWNGQQWKSMDLPDSLMHNITGLARILAVAAHNIWAVGTTYDTNQPERVLALHWDGQTWQQVSTPALNLSASQADSTASGITVYNGRQVWIVGTAGDESVSALIEGQRACP